MAKALVIFLLLPSLLFCQNLVPNPSFEELTACPTGEGQVVLASPWAWVLTPDLYSPCSGNSILQPPNIHGCEYLPAYDGKNYIGMYVYNSKEFVKVNLVDTLEAGRYYYARFYVAPNEDCNSNIPVTYTDAIGLAVKGTGPNDAFEIIAENSGKILKDTTKWTKVSGCFKAKGNELILQIGNFRNDNQTLLETNMQQVPDNQQFNYMYIDEVLVTAFDPFPDTVLMCNGSPVNLNANFYDADYQWDTGDTNALAIVADTGSYVVTATIDGCELREKVTVVNLDYNSLSPPDTSICQGDEIKLIPGIPGTYHWSNGSTSKNLVARKQGSYKATITNTCGEFKFQQNLKTEDCRCRLYIPNAFSPNGDGINDLLEIGLGCDYEYMTKHFEVFDRWGNSVFATEDIGIEKWDGYYRGKHAQAGIYTWFLTYDIMYDRTIRTILEEGGVTLIE